MKLIDLTHSINNDTPPYPGTESPEVQVVSTIPVDGFQELSVRFYSHTGTHLDCPAHLFPEAMDTQNTPLEQFMGKAAVLDVRDHLEKEVGLELIQDFMARHDGLDFLILLTGWDKRWGQETYYEGYPVLGKRAAGFLADSDIKGVGVDAVSLDPIGDSELLGHTTILSKGKIIIENLCNLEKLMDKEFTFCAFPLKFEKGDGSPVRAVAIL